MVFALLSTLALAQVAVSDDAPTPVQLLVAATHESEWVDEVLEDGRYTRFGTKDMGPVHVWRPRDYKPATADIVVYVHGFYTDVDRAVREHQLVTQFRDSGKNALFIVPETRSWRTDQLLWKDLEVLLTTVEKRLKLKRPTGKITVVAHSGGYKTVAEWLKHESVARVLLVDALYGNDDEFRAWVDTKENAKQLVLIGFDTQQHTEWFLRKHPDALRLDDLPYLYDDVPAAWRTAPLLYFQSERFDHMAMVTTGRVLPWLLHALK